MQYRFCPRCASPLEQREREGQQLTVCPACEFVNYRNSKPTAGAVIVRDGYVLLAKRGIEPNKGKWDLPGGFLHHGEHPCDGVIREIRKETGFQIEPERLVGMYLDVYDDEPNDPEPDAILNIYYEATAPDGDPQPTDDVAELRWFMPDDLPGEYAFAHTARALDDWRASLKRDIPDQPPH